MSKGTTSYRIKEDNAMYFLTFSTVNWIDVFTRQRYRDILVDSLQYCQENKGLELYSWCIMSNHVHMVARALEGYNLANILRDFKKITSKQIRKSIMRKSESRKKWLIKEMREAGNINSKKQIFQLWRNDNHPIIMDYAFIIDQKINYIHNNPVKAGIVDFPEQYRYSSARSYCGEEGLLKVIIP